MYFYGIYPFRCFLASVWVTIGIGISLEEGWDWPEENPNPSPQFTQTNLLHCSAHISDDYF